MRKVWRVLTWAPTPPQPWYAQMFRLLYTVPTVIILLGWADDTVHFDGAVTDDDVQVEKEPDWNAPLYLGDGQCMIVETREIIEC